VIIDLAATLFSPLRQKPSGAMCLWSKRNGRGQSSALGRQEFSARGVKSVTVTKFPKGRVLTALNAEVTTATIAITTMVIDRRQVTLSVFRQMVEEPIFDWEKMALRGVGWGYVNYKIEKHPDTAINLVFQRGEDLYRCIVQRRVTRMSGRERDRLLEGVLSERHSGEYAGYRDQVLSLNQWVWTPLGNMQPGELEKSRAFSAYVDETFAEMPPLHRYMHDLIRACRDAGVSVSADGGELILDAATEPAADLLKELRLNKAGVIAWINSSKNYGYDSEWETVAYKQWSARRQEHNERQSAFKLAHDRRRDAAIEAYREEVRAAYAALIGEWEKRYDQYEALVAPLFDLPHLYIAV
jgi:hypothetical protein